MTPEIDSLFSAAIENAFNAYLSMDPEGAEAFAKLQGSVVAIELTGINLTLHFLLGKPVQVMRHYQGEPDTLIRGTPIALARSTLDKTDGLFGGDIEITGNTEIGHRFQNALEQIDIDWEEHLARIVGDTPAHQAGRLFRQAQAYGRHAEGTLTRNISEYLREETRLLPSAIEVDNFMSDIDQLRDATDRLEARLQRLEKR